MKNSARLSLFGVLLVSTLVPATLHAAMVIIDFDLATPGSLLTADYVEDGITMQHVSGHYDIYPSGGSGDSPYLGLDVVAGESMSQVRFTGGVFDLVSLDVLYAASEVAGENQILTSSAGGQMALRSVGVQQFSGPQWSNLTWIGLSSDVNIAGPGFDSIRLNVVPIPGAVLLLGSGLLALLGLGKTWHGGR